MPSTETYFHRDGSPVPAGVGVAVGKAPGAGSYVRDRRCSRCGGAGRSDKWCMTGYVCFDCNGSGVHGQETVRVYSADRLAKVAAASAKRDAKRQAAAEARAAAAAAEAAARSDAFAASLDGRLVADYAAAWTGRDEFADGIVETARRRQLLTEKQAAVLVRNVARFREQDAYRATATWQGQVGKALDVEGDVVFAETRAPLKPYSDSGFLLSPRQFAIIKTPAGIVQFRGTPQAAFQKGARVQFVATVKAHETSKRDEPVTVVQRVRKVVTVRPAPEVDR